MWFLGYSLVAEKKECTGSEVDKGKFKTEQMCANACKGVASMFAFGTNDFGTDRCTSEGCQCICESGADEYGMCTTKDHKGYRLYRVNKGRNKFWNTSLVQNILLAWLVVINDIISKIFCKFVYR